LLADVRIVPMILAAAGDRRFALDSRQLMFLS
jgi:hypothetical protein